MKKQFNHTGGYLDNSNLWDWRVLIPNVKQWVGRSYPTDSFALIGHQSIVTFFFFEPLTHERDDSNADREVWIANWRCMNKKRLEKENLPRFVSVFVSGTEATAQGQKPVHMMFRSLPVRQACCSSLHCKEREMQLKYLWGWPQEKKEIAHSDETLHLEKGTKNELSFSAAFSCKVKIKNYT